ncbi:MAG: protoheme IX farnesyltransferase [candidate division Zixibacteria bacterium]|nr:protoheme IX farnesyltransferase [candidate division Zixibacteria bacterium]
MLTLAARMTLSTRLSSYFQLTKPRVLILVLFSGATALFIEGGFVSQPLNFLLVMLGLFLTGGSANALNQYFERDLDAKMSRTRESRPLPQLRIMPGEAIVFSIVIGIAGIILFAAAFNLLTALLALGNILFYGLFYTLYLKPNTSYNIVIGGIAGAMAPVGAWTAATGTIGWPAVFLFLIIFFWTPPHFWALALYLQDDYREVKLPMLPIVKGEEDTAKQIFRYTIILVLISLAFITVQSGLIYILTALIAGIIFLIKSYYLTFYRDRANYISLFKYSLSYLFVLFIAVVLEKYI